MTQSTVEATCRAIYGEAKEFFAKIKRAPDYGYKLFNSPPIYRPQVMFVGYQPGGGANDAEVEAGLLSHEQWPKVSEYAEADWPLARELRRMFEAHFDFHQCVGLNAIFLRSPKIKEYRNSLARSTRRAVRDFCTPCVLKIVDVLEPRKIVVIGFAALRLFGSASIDRRSNGIGRVLTRTGAIGGHNALAVLHLTGAHISSEDREQIRDRVLDFCLNSN